MRHAYRLGVLVGCLLLSQPLRAAILIDADPLAAGHHLGGLSFLTGLGTVTFTGEIRDPDSDPEFTAAGASGHVFDVSDGSATASLLFPVDVSSVTFIYGGNLGVFDLVAKDAGNNVVASFYQASTDDGQPAGPVTVSAPNIRSLFWQDPGWTFSAMDNVWVEAAEPVVPEPGTLALLGFGGLAALRRRRK